MAPTKAHKKHTRPKHRSTLSLQKTEVIINVYDLLAPGRWSNLFWHLGTSLLHSGVVINGREYAYGGHDRQGVTGVYWTKPRSEPPGGTFRCEILHGFTLATPAEIDAIIRSTSEEFLGPSYNLLTKNCNHFTAFLCLKLTGRPGPSWLNRAATIGVALPCIVPREWIEPPDYDTGDGELLLLDEETPGSRASESEPNDGGDDDSYDGHFAAHDERSSMLRRSSSQQIHLVGSDSSMAGARSTGGERSLFDESSGNDDGSEHSRRSGKNKARSGPMRDAAGHALPPSERLPGM
ncbi:DUF862 domain containing protein [Niveomyces insectorum RCEF 264]|uniref:DUF862 domain containing protein n=1 Tax=Niveomyces insectorum RCEF 264 TaxID=1081102 RepID=A0A167QRW1_9HYPO|nr:DUF862 domain containing protein [Niveomyces insectorum RCEF 264]